MTAEERPTTTDARRRNVRAVPDEVGILNDPALEQRVLAAVMADPDTVWPAIEGNVRPVDFYTPRHSLIFGAIEDVCARDQKPWAHHVVDELRRADLLEAAGGRQAVEAIAQGYEPGTTSGAVDDARLIASYARSRTFGHYADQLRQAAGRNDTQAALRILQDATEATAATEAAPTWVEADIGGVLEGGIVPVVPGHLARTDGECLLYEGKVHAFNAEPESGKSWLAMAACRERLAAGDHVLYLDFEADVESVLERMLALGTPERTLAERFHYVRPDDPFDVAARARLSEICANHHPSLAVIDGVAEVMALNAWDENANADIAAFLNALPRLLEREGATVVLIDHVVKDPRTRGRYARGGAHKLAGISGAAYTVETIRPFARGQVGLAKITVAKDRPGWVRRLAVGKKVAEFELDSCDDGSTVKSQIRPPAVGPVGSEFRPTGYMERVSRALEDSPVPLGLRAIRRVIGGTARYVDEALEFLVKDGFVERRPGPNRSVQHVSKRPYREESETYETDELDEEELDEEPF